GDPGLRIAGRPRRRSRRTRRGHGPDHVQRRGRGPHRGAPDTGLGRHHTRRPRRPRAQPRRRLPRPHRPAHRAGRRSGPRSRSNRRCRMSTTTITTYAPTEHRGLGRALGATSDAFAIAGRNLIAYRRVPQLLVFSTIQPVIFVLMFRYVFGGAIHVTGIPYVDFLMPGIFVQTVVFGSMAAAIGLATDMQSGLLERFRSLPMARSAAL